MPKLIKNLFRYLRAVVEGVLDQEGRIQMHLAWMTQTSKPTKCMSANFEIFNA